MDSPDYSDSEESSCSSGSSSIDSPPKLIPIRPKTTDLGKQVIFTSGQDKKQKYGVLRYLGEPEFSEGIWCGVVLDQPNGKNNGSIHGIRYFTCEANYGVFVPINKVEVDTSNRCSRSRPNSQPASRASSVERRGHGGDPSSSRPSSASKAGHQVHRQQGTSSSSSSTTSLGPASKMGLSMQQDLVLRLSQPIKRPAQPQLHHNQQASISSGRRQPMKAFATKRTEEASVKENKKPLMPFRAGGMYKASSSENLRSMKGKEKMGNGALHKVNQGMPSKKSSSERDLRNSGKSVGVGSKSSSSSSTVKSKRKQIRTNSCSDLLAGVSTTPSVTKPDHDANLSSRKISCDNHTYLDNYSSWPRTSTPGNRDELTPDGCSSPEETDDSLSKNKKEVLSLGPHNKGFVESPQDSSPPVMNGGGTGTVGKTEEGLATHAKQFAESELSSPSLPHLGVQSPEGGHAHNKLYYRNRPSGTATLSHPLSNSLITDGAHLLKQLLGPNQSLEGVSTESLSSLFDQQVQQWQSIVADLEEKLEGEKAKSKQLEEQLNQKALGAQQVDKQAKVSELTRKHKKEMATLHSTYRQPRDNTGLTNGSASTHSL